MRLLLIRHAETVDNVAGLYAGVRDSKLTVHGVEQATRLGEYFSREAIHFTHIFSSPLTRTIKTAEAIQKAQPFVSLGRHDNLEAGEDGENDGQKKVEIVRVPELIEQDFGYYEGKSFQARAADGKRMGREVDVVERRRRDPTFVDVESREAMAKRADTFLDEHLLPLFDVAAVGKPELQIAVVSHGMLLSTLWKRFLLRLPRMSITVAPEVTAAKGPLVLEHLGGWGNTGYLELSIVNSLRGKDIVPKTEDNQTATPLTQEVLRKTSRDSIRMLSGWSTTIVTVDSKAHLVGLKRQRGGIGRQAHDEGQKKLDGFFSKRQKLG